MKVTYNWLKDFVDIKLKADQLAHKLTMAGLEVTSLEKSGDDWVFEMEITSNRPDWLSIAGLAREVAAITNTKLRPNKKIQTKSTKTKNNNFQVKVQDKKGCSLYTGRLITGIAVKSSPLWMQKRLAAVGLRPVNNIVDITNYVLMETGQPLHAFDFDKLIDKTIIVRRAKKGEKIISIDQTELELDPSILVIADAKRPIAVAGIMGGVDTEVSQRTKNILLESAYFDPIITRRASRKLGLSSESSYRFERSVDLLGAEAASKKATNLIYELAGGGEEGFKSIPAQIKSKTQKIQTNTNRVNKILDTEISSSKIKTILDHLGFNVKLQAKGKILVSIPSFRQDVREEADLTEEVARCFGYDKIVSTLPYIEGRDIKAEETTLVAAIRDILIKLGLNETITFSLINRASLSKLKLNTSKLITIKNPLSQDQEVLRPTLLPSMLNCIAGNMKYNIKDFRAFEISHVFSDIKEPTNISIALTGEKPFGWQDQGRRNLDLFDLKGIIESLLRQLGIKNFVFAPSKQPCFSHQVSASLTAKDVLIGILGKADDTVLDKLNMAGKEIFLAELYLNKLQPFIDLSRSYVPLNRFPKILRNVSLVASKNVAFSAIEECIQKNTSDLLKDIQVVEQYKGGHVEKGAYGLTLLLSYQAGDHTLTDEEVNDLHGKICDSLVEELKVRIR